MTALVWLARDPRVHENAALGAPFGDRDGVRTLRSGEQVKGRTLERDQVLPAAPDQVFEFFADAHNLEAITPPWLNFRVVTAGPIEMGPGTLIEYRLRLHRFRINWVTRIESWLPGRGFEDRQVRGPYRLWHHTHSFEPCGGGTRVRDVVRYALPLGPLGWLAHTALVRRDLERIFDFRRDAVAAVFRGR